MLRRRLIALIAATAAFFGIFAIPMAVPAGALTTTELGGSPLGLIKICLTVSAADQRLCISI